MPPKSSFVAKTVVPSVDQTVISESSNDPRMMLSVYVVPGPARKENQSKSPGFSISPPDRFPSGSIVAVSGLLPWSSGMVETGIGVAVGTAVGVAVGATVVGTSVAVGTAVGTAVAVGAKVGIAVGVGIGVRVGVATGTKVGDGVGAAVAVSVGVSVAVG